MVKLNRERNTIKQTDSKVSFLPTRQQLRAFLQAKGVDPNQLNYMTYTDQIRLTKEYCQLAGSC